MKGDLGQFYTTNYKYILESMEIPANAECIIEPFAGSGELLGFLENIGKYTIELYDIDPKYHGTIQQDTLKYPPSYEDKFVLTNPPYLARNKSKNKELYDIYNCNDLYKCFIRCLIKTPCIGGIMILPLNFISSIRKADIVLRKDFLNVYTINQINIFEEKVFEDTSCSVCSILFEKKQTKTPIRCILFPSRKEIELLLSQENNFTVGGEIYNLTGPFKIQRATHQNIEGSNFITNILLKCIDDTSPLGFTLVDNTDKFIDNTPNLSARSYATVVLEIELSIEKQTLLVEKMNSYIREQRNKYHSLFLSNYRELNRKRISFELAFRICNFFLSTLE